MASVGGAIDVAWHTALGEETGIARIVAPGHLLLFGGIGLVVTTPLRSAWHARSERTTSLRMFLPAVFASAQAAAVTLFVTQWLSPFVTFAQRANTSPGDASVATPFPEHAAAASMSGILIVSVVLLSSALHLLRRFDPPFGSLTILFATTSVLGSFLVQFTTWRVAASAIAAGSVADLVLRRASSAGISTRTVARLIGLVSPSVLCVASWGLGATASWDLELSFGIAVLAAFAGAVLATITHPAPFDVTSMSSVAALPEEVLKTAA